MSTDFSIDNLKCNQINSFSNEALLRGSLFIQELRAKSQELEIQIKDRL